MDNCDVVDCNAVEQWISSLASVSDLPAWIAAFVSVVALLISARTLMMTRNQRRPYLIFSFDVKEQSLRLLNYGGVPARLDKVEYSEGLDSL